MWTNLVAAYESKLDVLEEARRAYLAAVTEQVAEAGLSIEQAVRESLDASAGGHAFSYGGLQTSEDSAFTGAPWTAVTISDALSGTECRVASWVASSFGGPVETLRLAFSIEKVRPGLDLREWASRWAGAISAEAPGDPFSPVAFPDARSDRAFVRIVSIDVSGRVARDVADEARKACVLVLEQVLPMLDHIRDAGLAMVVAERALLAYRPTLEAKAALINAPVIPKQGDLGKWQGGRFLQVGDYWVRALPATNELLVECNLKDAAVVDELARRLGRTVDRSGGRPHFVLVAERELRQNDSETNERIEAAFECWFELNAAGRDVTASE